MNLGLEGLAPTPAGGKKGEKGKFNESVVFEPNATITHYITNDSERPKELLPFNSKTAAEPRRPRLSPVLP